MKTLEKAKSRFKTTFTAEFFSDLAYSRLKDFTNALARYTAAEVIGRATDTNRLTTFLLSVWGGLRGHEAMTAEKYLKMPGDVARLQRGDELPWLHVGRARREPVTSKRTDRQSREA